MRTVIWDSHCSFCRPWAVRLARLDVLRLHRFVGTSEPDAYADPRVTPEHTDHALQLLTPAGRYEGYDAIRRVLLRCPPVSVVAPLLWLPGARWLGDRLYRRVAESRTCGLGPAQPPIARGATVLSRLVHRGSGAA
ncbi:MAG: thiol-disulfide oxidoreductase DCC family protein [Nocardioides sp.]|uniref:thiol-disulfide oxidoreductase DCC family protein n=1 Tax=Nocardioides sp. TaxID=35761 RepID=UPI003F013AC2